jgi:hypothetical protein
VIPAKLTVKRTKKELSDSPEMLLLKNKPRLPRTKEEQAEIDRCVKLIGSFSARDRRNEESIEID